MHLAALLLEDERVIAIVEGDEVVGILTPEASTPPHAISSRMRRTASSATAPATTTGMGTSGDAVDGGTGIGGDGGEDAGGGEDAAAADAGTGSGVVTTDIGRGGSSGSSSPQPTQ